MNKLILCVAILGLFACNSATENGYTVHVTLTGDTEALASDTLILTNRAKGENLITDTVVLRNGEATFKGYTETPQNVALQIKGERSILAKLFLENTVFDVNILLGTEKPVVSIEGGPTQKFIDSMQQQADAIYQSVHMDSLMKVYPTASKETKDSIMTVYNGAREKISAMEKAYIRTHPASLYTLDKLMQELDGMDLDTAKTMLAVFQALPQYQNNKNLKKAAETITALENLKPGKIAPDFTQNDPNGNPVKFSDVYQKNKVTMVDFWASWCGPCRSFNPALVKIYNEYKSKGFGILGVSLDTKHDAWIKAIEDDHLTWEQVSDLGGWKNAVAVQYLVHFIPQNIFVDRDGKIIKRQVSEEEIIEILNEHLK